MSRTYPNLGAVKPHVKNAALEIGNRFDVATIHGIGMRTGASDHPIGLALDFMVGTDRAKGDQISNFVKQNWKRLGVKYIIWYQRIDNGSGWEPMEDRGSNTANHKDHPHVSFERSTNDAGDYTGDKPTDVVKDTAESIEGDYPWDFLTYQSTWKRVFMFLAGIVFIGYFVWRALTNG